MDYKYHNVLARQLNGPVVQSFMKSDHDMYTLNKEPEWFEHRRTLSLDTATTEELNLIGKFLGIPRPFCTSNAHAIPLDMEFKDGSYQINAQPDMIQETAEGYTLVLNDFLYNAGQYLLYPPGETVVRQADDDMYRLYIMNMASLRKSHSILDLADMLYMFNAEGTFELEFQASGDILIYLDSRYKEYEPFLQIALDLTYNALPRIGPIQLVDYANPIVDHCFITQSASIADPDWLCWTEGEVGILTAPASKLRAVNEGLIPNTDKYWIYGNDGTTQGYGVGFYNHTLFMTIGETRS